MDRLPARIGKYEVLGLIGQGAMGVVYKARDPLMNRVVALKQLSMGPALAGAREEEFKARFIQEAHAAGNLKHPNIVTIYDVDLADGTPFMAMEYLAGGSLAAWMKSSGAMPLARAIPLVRAVGLGLAYAHGRGIIHRDIKPDNILLDLDGRPVITDFGAAHLQNSELTQTGEVLGTPHYMSPEQVLSEPIDGRSDLFALGVVFYLLVTGRRPFKGDTVSSVCYHIVHSSPEPIPRDLPEIQALAPVLERLLAKRREDRFATGDDLAQALDRVQLGDGHESRIPSMTQTLDLRTPTPFPSRAPATTASAPDRPPALAPAARTVEPPIQSGSPAPPPSGTPPVPSRKPLWPLLLALGAGAALLVVLVLSLGGWWLYRRSRPAAAPPPPIPVTTPPTSYYAEREAPPPTELESPPAPDSASAPRSTPAPRPTVASPSPKVPPAPPPSPTPSLAASFAEVEREAEAAAQSAQAHRFEEAFRGLDAAAARLEQLSATAPPSDGPALEAARASLARATASIHQALAAWAKPLLDRSVAAFAKATEHMNADEEAIIQAYAEASPILRWKERLPSDLAQAADAFVEECRDNLNDKEWAEAEAAAQGKAAP